MESSPIFILFIGLYSTVNGAGRNGEASNSRAGHVIAVPDPHQPYRGAAEDRNDRDRPNNRPTLRRALQDATFGYVMGQALDTAIMSSTGTATNMGRNTGAAIGLTFGLVREIVQNIMAAQNPPDEPALVRGVMQVMLNNGRQLPSDAEQQIRQLVHRIRAADTNDGQGGH